MIEYNAPFGAHAASTGEVQPEVASGTPGMRVINTGKWSDVVNDSSRDTEAMERTADKAEANPSAGCHCSTVRL
jgi:hypothetical protein